MLVPEMPTRTKIASPRRRVVIDECFNRFAIHFAANSSHVGHAHTVLFHSIRRERFGKLHHEVSRALRPAIGSAIAADRRVIFDRQTDSATLLPTPCCKSQHDMRVVRGGERIFVQTATFGRRQFGGDFGIVQKHAVVTRRAASAVMRKTRGVTPALHPDRPATIAQSPIVGISKTSPRPPTPVPDKCEWLKTLNHRIGIVVTGTAVPTLQRRVGRDLHHAKRHGGAGIGMTVFGGADKRIGGGNNGGNLGSRRLRPRC